MPVGGCVCMQLNLQFWDFPGGAVVKTPSFQQGTDLIPGQETKISHAKGCGQAPAHPHPTVVLLVAASYKSTPVFPLHPCL